MSTPFDPLDDLIYVEARVEGPTGIVVSVPLALDTGATDTMISVAPLVAAGYNPVAVPAQHQVATSSGVIFVPSLPVLKLTALGKTRLNFDVLAHTVPPTAGVDGVLGLDFLRGGVLTIDFRTGQITLL